MSKMQLVALTTSEIVISHPVAAIVFQIAGSKSNMTAPDPIRVQIQLK
jgi:hypothetical protein